MTKTPLSTRAVDLLSDPTLQLAMAADGVYRASLRDMLETASVATSPESSLPDGYRRGVGMMVVDSSGRILIGQRSDLLSPAWQMPQGGIAEGEHPHQAAIRELREEIGTSNVEILAESAEWYAYELPPEFANPLHRWRGQRQKWLLLRFTGEDSDINVATEHPEFSAWRWAEPEEVLSLAAPFKSEVYRQVLREFRPVLRPDDDIAGTPV